MHRRKTLALGLAAAALTACGLAYAFDADAPESLQHVPVPTRIDCVGLSCGGLGGPLPRNWSYWVQPETAGIDTVKFGVEIPNLAPSSVVMPSGWSYSIVPNDTGSFLDNRTFTAHGNTSSPTGSCDSILVFTGPTQTQAFQLGYNGGQHAHQVEWKTSPVVVGTGMSSWLRPVGLGLGPVHGPKISDQPVSPSDATRAAEGHGH